MKLAAQKMRIWRKRQSPPISLRGFAPILAKVDPDVAYGAMQLSRIERGTADPKLAFMVAIRDLGIADLDDWTVPATKECTKAKLEQVACP